MNRKTHVPMAIQIAREIEKREKEIDTLMENPSDKLQVVNLLETLVKLMLDQSKLLRQISEKLDRLVED